MNCSLSLQTIKHINIHIHRLFSRRVYGLDIRLKTSKSVTHIRLVVVWGGGGGLLI